MDNQKEKIKESEMIVGGGLMLLIDGGCAIADSTLVGVAITPPVQSFVTLCTSWWFWKKGDADAFKLGKQITQHAANLLPWLPTLTASFAINVFIHNHPRLARLAGEAVQSATGGTGKVVGTIAGEIGKAKAASSVMKKAA